jgi:hypothetical protein
MRLGLLLAIAVAIGFLPSLAAAAGPDFAAAFHDVQQLCDRYLSPNSMALKPGIDPTQNQKNAEYHLHRAAAAFLSPEGMAFLRQRSESTDDGVRACAKKLLEFSATPNR